MEDFVSELRQYLKSAQIEEIRKEWEETKALDSIGPKVEEYFLNHPHFRVRSECLPSGLTFGGSKYNNPKFSSGFLFVLN